MVMLVLLKQSNFNHVTINEIIAALEPINQRPLKTIGLIRINFTICPIFKFNEKLTMTHIVQLKSQIKLEW